MAMTRRRDIRTNDDPWKISALVSALVELISAVLLLLNTSITFITSQLVIHFDIEPPCSYVGCSHPLSHNHKKTRCFDQEKTSLHELCPHCHNSLGNPGSNNQEVSIDRNSRERPCHQDEDNNSSNDSNTSRSDADILYLDGEESLYSDVQDGQRSFSANCIRIIRRKRELSNHRKDNNLMDLNSRDFTIASHTARSSDETCIPLPSRKHISACGDISSAEYSLLPPESCRITDLDEEKNFIGEAKVNDAFVFSDRHLSKGHSSCNSQCGYMLLIDTDGNEGNDELFYDTLETASVSDAVFVHTASESEDEMMILDSENVLSKPAAKNKSDHINIVSGHNALSGIGYANEANSCVGSTGQSKLPSVKDASENEYHYTLLNGGRGGVGGDDDDDINETQPFEKLNSDSAQPLLHHDASSVELEASSALERVSLLEAHSVHHGLSDMKTRATPFGTHQHAYMLLEDNDECSSGAPYQDAVASLIHGAYELESKSPKHSDLECAKFTANVDEAFTTSNAEKHQHPSTIFSDDVQHYMETPYQEIVASDYSQPSLHRDQKLQLECSKNSAVECVESATGSADCLITNNEQKHEHPYVLLANDDENYFKAPCQDSMASDCLLPLLDGVQELESELPKQSDLQCFELFAEASDSLTSKNNQISEESVHDESSKNRKNSYPELSSISCAVQFTDTHLEGSSIEQDIYTSPNAESSKLYHSCEEIVDDGESNCNCPTTDDALSHVTCSNIQHARETDVPLEASSLGKEGGNTSLADPLVAKPDEVAEVPNSNFYKSLTVDALSLGLPSMGTQKEATGSQETLIQLHTGPCTSDPKKLWVKDLNLMKRTHDETLDRSDLWSNNVLSVQDFDLSKMHQQPDLLQRSHGICCVQTEAKDEALTSGVSFIQKRSTNGASIGLDTTSNFSSEMHDRAIVHLRTNLEERNMKNKAIFATENTRVQQAYIRGDKGTLDLISPAFEEEDEEFQIDEEDAVSLRNALLAEKKMLALLETELENERNAAAIATSEAMAMISRLQEEKSTMQLEAAQLQRMAEEKADYDEQAITLLKDLLIKRETEKHALEKELELYREKLMLEKTSIVDKNKDLLVVPFTRSTSERKIVDKNKDLLVVPFTRSTSERKINEVGAAFLLDEENHRQEVVPLVDEVCNSEKTFQKKQSTVHEENAVQPGESTESRRPQNCFVKDVVDTDDEEGSSCCFSRQISGQHHSHHELEVMSESIFTADDDGETRFILERLRVIEEELRELRKLDGERAQWKSSDAEYLNGCSSDRAGPGHIREAEAGLDSGESGHGIVLQLPLHDVYEVQCAPSQERIEIPEETRHPPKDALYHSLAPAMDPQNSGSMTSTIKSFLAGESPCDNTSISMHPHTYFDDPNAQRLKLTEGEQNLTHIIEQLVARLKVIETNRQLLEKILEFLRHRDSELKLLQMIAQELQELRMLRFGSTWSSVQPPSLSAFGESCSQILKKRRFCSDSEANTVLLHQRSI